MVHYGSNSFADLQQLTEYLHRRSVLQNLAVGCTRHLEGIRDRKGPLIFCAIADILYPGW
jgi:hypothetical protein